MDEGHVGGEQVEHIGCRELATHLGPGDVNQNDHSDIPIIFHAILQGASCIKIDGDGGGRVTFTVPDSDKESLKRLIDRRSANLVVSVEQS